MKFEDQMTPQCQQHPTQRPSDVRWTDFGGTGQNSRNLRRTARKSAKLERRQQSSQVAPEVSEVATTTTSPFQSCCSRVPAIGSAAGSDSASSEASWTNGARWQCHRFQWVAVLYIVAVVLVGAISEVHCDAALSSRSSGDGGSSSGTAAAPDGGHLLEDHYEGGGHYTHHWAVHIPEGGSEQVERVAEEHGFINHGKVS